MLTAVFELTELLQLSQVDTVLSCPLLCRTEEEVGLLEDEETLQPLIGVQHGFVAQPAHFLELIAQQALTAERGEPLRKEKGSETKRSHKSCP